jgi:hypothetical protein
MGHPVGNSSEIRYMYKVVEEKKQHAELYNL